MSEARHTGALLRDGLRIGLLSDGCTPDLISIGPGTKPLRGVDCAPNCVVPRAGWRDLGPAERQVLLADGRVSPDRNLLVFDAGSPVLEASHEELLPLVREEGDGGADARAAVENVRRLLLGSAAEVCGFRGPSRGRGDLIVHAPGQPSTAFNHESGKFMGLHIDNHQKLSLRERDGAQILCAVNVGFSERYLHLVNLPVSALVDVLAERGISEPGSAEELKDAFLEEFPDYPVIRVTLLPGHAYLCNTQNTIHDGATKAGDLPDVSFLTMNELEPVREGAGLDA